MLHARTLRDPTPAPVKMDSKVTGNTALRVRFFVKIIVTKSIQKKSS